MTNLKPLTILLVEDDPAHARLVELNLRRAGVHNIIIALDNGNKALELLFSQGQYKNQPRPDPLLILLDLNMPSVDGYQVLQRIKKDESLKQIPVIVLTTIDDQDEIDKCYQLGCNAYINKPFIYDRFFETVRELGFFIEIMAPSHSNQWAD